MQTLVLIPVYLLLQMLMVGEVEEDIQLDVVDQEVLEVAQVLLKLLHFYAKEAELQVKEILEDVRFLEAVEVAVVQEQ
jgi:hypothetical protein